MKQEETFKNSDLLFSSSSPYPLSSIFCPDRPIRAAIA